MHRPARSLLLLAALAVLPPAAPASAAEGKRIRTVNVLVLSTMLASDGIGEWGFAALVEADGRRILFDTGARPETVLRNARELRVDLSTVTDVILSHHHADHTGGLLTLRRELSRANPAALSRVHVARGIFLSRPGPDGAEGNPMLAAASEYKALGGAIIEYDAAREISSDTWPGAWLTGPVPRRHPERNWSGRGQLRREDGTLAEDNLPEDQSLVLDTEQGLVVISGCGHAGVVNTLEAAQERVRKAPVHALIGGFHLFEASEEHLQWTAAKLRGFGVANLLGAHCTGIESVYRLRALLALARRTCAVAAVGGRFTLEGGLAPGVIAR